MHKSRRSLIRFGLFLAWLLVVVAGYFVAHKPADNAQLLALAGWIPTVLIGLVLVLVAGAVGQRILNRWHGGAERALLALGLGLGVFSALTLMLGLIGALRPEIAWALIAIGAWFGRRAIRSWWGDLRQLLVLIKPTTSFAKFAAFYCTLVLSIAFAQALAPATAWDGLAYHLKGPDIYLAAGRITHTLDLPYLGFPQFGEMLFLYVRLLGGAASTLVHWVFALATTLLIAAQARRLWGETSGWIAAAIFLSAETVVIEAGWPYVDLMLAFCILAAYICLQSWREDQQRTVLVLAGIFSGFAMATKYSAAPIVVGLLFIVVIRSGRARFRSTLQLAGIAALAAAPWYLKSLLLTGNPFYPFVFGGLYWDSIRSQIFSRWDTGLAFTAPWQLLTAPWDATIWGIEGKVGYAATIGPLFLMLFPITLLAWKQLEIRQRRALADGLMICGIAYISWLYGLAMSASLLQSRLLIPIFPLLAIIAVGSLQVLSHWDRPSLSLRRISTVLVTLVLIATGLKITLDFGRAGVVDVLLGGQWREDYLTDHLGWYYVAMQSLNELDGSAHVLFLWEPRSLYCNVDCWPDSMIDNWWHARRTIGSSADIALRWQQAGIQYLVVFQPGYQAAFDIGLDPSTPEDQRAFGQFVDEQLALVKNFGDAYYLYRWRKNIP